MPLALNNSYFSLIRRMNLLCQPFIRGLRKKLKINFIKRINQITYQIISLQRYKLIIDSISDIYRKNRVKELKPLLKEKVTKLINVESVISLLLIVILLTLDEWSLILLRKIIKRKKSVIIIESQDTLPVNIRDLGKNRSQYQREVKNSLMLLINRKSKLLN